MMKWLRIFFSLAFFTTAAICPIHANSTPPTTSITLNGTVGLNDWYTSGVDVDLVAHDLESGVASINWRLNDEDWQRETFLGTLNRIQNPSFEDGSFWGIDDWSHPYYPSWKALLWHSYIAKYGSRSALVWFYYPGAYFWTNEGDYAVVTPAEVYTASVWVQTVLLSGDGANLRVWVKKSSGPDELIGETAKLSGTNNWTRLALTFTTPADAVGVYYQLNSSGSFGIVYWDGASLVEEGETAVDFTIGTSGEHTLEFYSVDNAGNEELPHQTLDFKIDTSAPSGWSDFEAEQTLNNHTFKISIEVTDPVSGLDVDSAAYQYTYDGGATWSPWLTDLTVEPAVDGSNEVTLTTPDVDFRDSNWESGKAIRFKVSDLAGLEGVSPDQNLFGAFLQTTGGDVYSGGNVQMSASGPDPGAEGLVVAAGSSIDNFSSSNNWQLTSYPSVERLYYNDYQERFLATPLPDGKLPLTSGRYFAGDGDFVVDNSTIPSGPAGDLASIENLAAVVFVGSDLIVSRDLELHPSSVILFIVGGDVRIAKNVELVDASFLADGNFDSSYNGAPPQTQLTLNGLVAASELVLRRSLSGNDNLDTPAEIINYPPQVINLAPYLGEGEMGWQELK